ncbi:MAG: replicative DNA helicase [Deltaproteobacteria bacterium]|nr:replicative DNA helicase [Deltaproteobacteria bacterium]
MHPSNSDPYKTPPHNHEAEQSVLAGILIDPDALGKVLEFIIPDDFYRESHRKIFHAMVTLFEKGEPTDLLVVANELKRSGALEEIGGYTYLSSLVDLLPSSANIVSYARIIKEKAVLRGLIHAATEIISQGYDSIDNIDSFLDNAEQIIFRVSEKRSHQSFYPVKDIVKQSFKDIESLHEKKGLLTGTPTGFRDLDRLTCGLQSSDLIIVAGRPSMGKTALALNMVENASCDHGVCTAVFSLEMSKEQLVQRMLCGLGKVDGSKLRGGFLNHDDWTRLTKAADKLSRAPMFIDDTPALSILEMRAKARRLKKENNLGLIVVDYLQLMRAAQHSDSREREISEISRSLKALAKELSVPVIALSQLNRSVENRADRRPQLSDLRESGAIEQDADVIAFIYRDEVYNKNSVDKGVAEIIIGKQRNGPIGMVRLAFLSHYTRFENLAAIPDNMPQYG